MIYFDHAKHFKFIYIYKKKNLYVITKDGKGQWQRKDNLISGENLSVFQGGDCV